MSPLMYWTLFSILLGLLIVFVGYLLVNIIWDVLLRTPEPRELSEEKERTLNKYRFDRNDVEDLTRIEKDFRTVIPNVNISNEVENSPIKETIDRKYSLYASESTLDNSEISMFKGGNGDNQTFKEKTKISQSVVDLEFCDPNAIDILQDLAKIEKEAEAIEEHIKVFTGGNNDLKFYEINEKLIRLMISLSDIYCERDELRKRKTSVLEYIQGCQKELKSRFSR
ncbi:hypothetical protein JTB14_027103 [Gonioctena quinquepunctata]|nr:hypothetical protein JTB14_027103 [Gonioctena quinquepunctata]